jgi:hypothetical protein
MGEDAIHHRCSSRRRISENLYIIAFGELMLLLQLKKMLNKAQKHIEGCPPSVVGNTSINFRIVFFCSIRLSSDIDPQSYELQHLLRMVSDECKELPPASVYPEL